MLVQSVLGLLLREQYRDPPWIRAAWFGNDWITLTVAAPLLATALVVARRGSVRGRLLWCGLLGYAVYNYAFYLLGAALNIFFPLYVALTILAVGTLGLALRELDAQRVAARFSPGTPVRAIGGYFVLVALSLGGMWLAMWGSYVFAGRPTPVEPEAFKLVAALDLTLMVPALGAGGFLLWRGRPWGYVIAPIAGAQASLYLLVLCASSAIAIARGLVQAPGELPAWGAFMALTAGATGILLANVRRHRRV
jgi:hypothetical protein